VSNSRDSGDLIFYGVILLALGVLLLWWRSARSAGPEPGANALFVVKHHGKPIIWIADNCTMISAPGITEDVAGEWLRAYGVDADGLCEAAKDTDALGLTKR
jgi:hypothetical protein